jgi:hypothetical protein
VIFIRYKIFIFVFAVTMPLGALAQIGGLSTYNFLKLTPSARVTALGGAATATDDNDVNLTYFNPALLNKEVHNRLGMSVVNYVADINYGNLAYAYHHSDRVGTFGASVAYINYGSFERNDPAGNTMGDFNANELALQFGWGKEINEYFRTGAHLKYIGSFLESYRSHGMAIDMSAMYVDTANRVTAAFVVRNFGTQLSSYAPEGVREFLPLDVQLAVTNKLKYVPFRWGLVFHSLHNWRLRYEDPTDVFYRRRVLLNEGEEQVEQGNPYVDEFFRHLIVNGELLLSKNFHLRFGYNHQRRRELVVPTRFGASGFSWGFGIQVKRFRFDYGSGALSLAGSSNNFSITTNLGDW